ncbi:restriction endonuclease subunit S [Cronobacter turicensis]|uniref:Restriction endonuclease subunit S n=2 Tax=Cronobacter turicensis TaxID=413502 RepID=A0A2T7B7A9_9ENTR|nr:restriction endonuclease subunit S [Cronobacter turicensis]EKM0378094.1 restriction endonuclease subunit S [Cronobacter turicensis]ELQ6021609.1 restriction endonuclease subunit S [Cronobacter turicensis]ELQ6075555.1 restriction endonuclease subunit S [Cronobacter turicensis]ELQ6184534.1 restriction endonuclease subunit S [Cronobacter turicensis]ELQ6232941.1 restriction endonuclease subunit S [Cronobacter turicensis]
MAKYKAYPEYKDSGVEWLGEVPSHWNVAKTMRYFKIAMGQTILKEQLEDDGEWPVYSATEGDSYFGYVSSPQVKLGVGDLVIPARGNSIGSVKLVSGKSTTTQTTIYCKHLTQAIYPAFAYYFMLGNRKNLFWFTQTAIPQITVEEVGCNPILLPTYEEQVVVASFLDHETAKIDNLIEKQQQLIELLKEKCQAVISHAVTKGLNPDVPMKDSGVEWLGEVPQHWDVLRLKHLISSLESGCSVNAADIPAQQGEVAVLKTSCVYTRSFRANENKTVVSEDLHRVKCPVRKGSIIISRMNTPDLVGASALVDVDAENIYLPDRLWQTNFNSKLKLIPAYLAHFMTTQGFRTQISLGAEGASSSMQNIAKDDYLSINCLLPSIEEQQEITSFLEEKLSYFSDLELRSSETIQLLQERRTALISAAVTGKIDVRDWVAPETQDVEESQEATA